MRGKGVQTDQTAAPAASYAPWVQDVQLQRRGARVRHGTAIGLVVLLLLVLGAMSIQLLQAQS